MLASLIYERGILDPDYMVTRTLRTKDGPFEVPVRGVKLLAKGEDVPIRFLGLFDTDQGGYTAGSVAPSYLAIPPNVQTVRHAIARDEHRISFPLTALQSPACPPNSRLAERGFRGAHADIGGGYLAGGIAKMTLRWMRNEAVDAGVPFNYLSPNDLPGDFDSMQPHDSTSLMKDPFGYILPPGMFTRSTNYPPGCPTP